MPKLFFLIVVIIIFVGQLVYAQPRKNPRDNSAQNTNANVSPIPFNNSVTQKENETNTENSTYQKERDTKDEAFRAKQAEQNQTIVDATVWIAVFAGLSFFAALAFAIISILQWRQNRELFNRAERPSLGVERCDMFLEIGKPIRVNVVVKNTGRSPAKMINGRGFISLVNAANVDETCCPEPNLDRPITGMPSTPVIAVNGTRMLFLNLSQVATGADIMYLEKGKVILHVWCKIDYTSFAGTSYFTEYYAQYVHPKRFDECSTHNDAN
jgi:cbb3-type cytochrome oxidase subunit 3